MVIASSIRRTLGYLIDIVIIYILINLSEYSGLLTPLILFFYYFALESLFGKTIGKVITKTHIQDIDGNKPGGQKIFIRTITRFIPFEIFTFFFQARPIGLHDKLSKTHVVEDTKQNKIVDQPAIPQKIYKQNHTKKTLESFKTQEVVNKSKFNYKTLLIIVFACPLFLILCIVLFKLMGYEINKEYFTYSKDQCISQISKDELQHELYWERWDRLLKENDYVEEFKPDYAYCQATYKGFKESCFDMRMEFVYDESRQDFIVPSSLCDQDKKCSSSIYIYEKQKENWSYLTSESKDQFYWDYVNSKCPTQSIFK